MYVWNIFGLKTNPTIENVNKFIYAKYLIKLLSNCIYEYEYIWTSKEIIATINSIQDESPSIYAPIENSMALILIKGIAIS